MTQQPLIDQSNNQVGISGGIRAYRVEDRMKGDMNSHENKFTRLYKQKKISQNKLNISPQQANNNTSDMIPITTPQQANNMTNTLLEPKLQPLTQWMYYSMADPSQEFIEWYNTKMYYDRQDPLFKFLEGYQQLQRENLYRNNGNLCTTFKYFSCLDHQFFNENGFDKDYCDKFVKYSYIAGKENQEWYLALYALSQTIVEQTMTINGITATQAIYQNEYIIYTDPVLSAGWCSVVCDKCGAKIVNPIYKFVTYLEKVYSGKITNEELSNLHHINCGNQFFSKVGVGISKSQSNIGPYEFIGLGDPTELAKLQWEVLPDFSILGYVFNDGRFIGNQRGGERTNLQNENYEIQQLAKITTQNNGQLQANRDITNAFNDIPENTIRLQDGQLPGFDNIMELLQIRQRLNELLEQNVFNEQQISELFNSMWDQFNLAFRGVNGDRKQFTNIRELVEYLLKFKQFVDKLYNEYRNTPFKIYISNTYINMQTIDNLITWITDVWKRIQVFIQVLFWSGQQNDQVDRRIQVIRQNIQNAQQNYQNLGENILKWWYKDEFIIQQIIKQVSNCYDEDWFMQFINILNEEQANVMVQMVEDINLQSRVDDITKWIDVLQPKRNDNGYRDFQDGILGLIQNLTTIRDFKTLDILYNIYNIYNNIQDAPQNNFNTLLQSYNGIQNLNLTNQIKNNLQTFCILLYAYLLCQDDTENVNIFNQMICKLKHVKAQIKQVHVFRVAHLIDLGKQIHCLYGDDAVGGQYVFDQNGYCQTCQYDDIAKNYIQFEQKIQQFQNILKFKIKNLLIDQFEHGNIQPKCLFEIQHQLPLNTQDIKHDQDIQQTSNMFGQVYDDMNITKQHIVYSPIFGQVPLRPGLVVHGVVQNGDGLNEVDITYFRKQTIKYMITHNMLKYHYAEITENTQNNFVQNYIRNQSGQKMNTIIRGVIQCLQDGDYKFMKSKINGEIYIQCEVKYSNNESFFIKIKRHDQKPNAFVYKIGPANKETRESISGETGYKPWDQIYLILEKDLPTLSQLSQPFKVQTQAVYVNHGLFQINPQKKNVLKEYKYFLELQEGGFVQNDQNQQNFFKLQIYGKFLYDLIVVNMENPENENNITRVFKQSSSAFSTLVNMWLHAGDNLQKINDQNQLVNYIPDAVQDIIHTFTNQHIYDQLSNRATNILEVLNTIYNEVFLQRQQPQDFINVIIKQIIAITVLRAFNLSSNTQIQDIRHVFQNLIPYNLNYDQQKIELVQRQNQNFLNGYENILTDKFNKITDLLNSLLPGNIDYNLLLNNINTFIRSFVRDFNINNQPEKDFITALQNMTGQCDKQYPIQLNKQI